MIIKKKWTLLEEIKLYEFLFEEKLSNVKIAKLFNVCLIDIVEKKELMISNKLYYNLL